MAAVLLVGLLVAACSRFESAGGDAEPVSVGAGLTTATSARSPGVPDATAAPAASSTTAEMLVPPPTRASGDTVPPVTGRTVVRTGVANRSVVEHPGWRVTLTVGDRRTFAVADEIPIEVVLTNTTDRVRYHEVDQPDSVVIAASDRPDRRAWSHVDCNRTLDVYKVPGGLRATDPGEETPMIVRYPMSEECRLPAGEYLVFGQWSVCPDDARRETANPGTFVCEDGAAYLVDAGPVHLTLR